MQLSRILTPAALFCAVLGATAMAFLSSGPDRNIKLNGPLALSPAGDVLEYTLTPDGSRVVFTAQAEEGRVELLSLPRDGSAAQVRLSAPVLAGGSIGEFHVTADGTRVVYRADQDVRGQFELYAVPVDGSQAPVKISGILPADRDVRPEVYVSRDGARVVYRADADLDQVNELYSAPLDASAAPVKLNTPLGSGASVRHQIALTPDSTRAVFRTELGNVSELFSAPIDGSGVPVSLGLTGIFTSMQVTADSTRVVFRSERDLAGVRELFVVPVDGSAAPIKLNAPLVALGDVKGFALTPDSARAVYLADQDTNEVEELFGVPLDTSAAPVRLNNPMDVANLGTIASVYEWSLTPDGTAVVYHAIEDLAIPEDLLVTPVDGSTPPIGLSVLGAPGFQVSPDSSHVLFLTSPGSDGRQLYSVPLDGSTAPFRVSTPLSQSQTVSAFFVPPGGDRVVFQTDFGGGRELYSVPFDGSAGAQSLILYTLNASANEVQFTPDGSQVVFRADEIRRTVFQLFDVPIDGSAPAVPLNEPLIMEATGTIIAFEPSPDGRWAVYRAWADSADSIELYSVPTDMSGPVLRLNTALPPLQNVVDFVISPDSTRVVYAADQDTQGVVELYSVPIDGSLAPTKLNDPFPAGANVYVVSHSRLITVTSDSSRVLYLADAETDELQELFSAPIDGGSSPVKLNHDLPSAALRVSYAVTNDSTHAVYMPLFSNHIDAELYSVPVDGSAAPISLSGPMGPDQDVVGFTISPDSSRAIYRADQDTDSVFELYSVPVDGGSAPVKVSHSLVPGRDVGFFEISQDSTRVVYGVTALWSVELDGTNRVQLTGVPVSQGGIDAFDITSDSTGVVFFGDFRVNILPELFYVPIDGREPERRISADLVQGGHIRSWQVSPDGSRVLYNADAENDTWWRLYSVPVSGGPVTRINGPLPFPGDVQQRFHVSPDSRYVVYEADQETDGLNELFAVPIDGRTSAPFSTKVNGPFVEGATVGVFTVLFAPDSSRVFYSADQEVLGSRELFATDLVPEITSVSPDRGPMTGGNTVTLHGCGFTEQTQVFFAGKPAPSVTYVDASELRVVVPPNRRFPTQTAGPGTGRARRAVIPEREVDIRVSEAGIDSILEASYSYLPSLRR